MLLLLCCGGIFGYRAVFKDDAEDVADKYLSAIQDKSLDDLRAVVCASEQKRIDDDEWDDDDEGLLDWEITSSKERENSATVTAEFTGTDGGKIRTGDIVMTLLKEDGDWKVCDVDETRD